MPTVNITGPEAVSLSYRLAAAGEYERAAEIFEAGASAILGFPTADAVRTLTLQGHKIAAIRIVRQFIPGATLKMAKDYVEMLAAAAGRVDDYGNVRRYTTSNR